MYYLVLDNKVLSSLIALDSSFTSDISKGYVFSSRAEIEMLCWSHLSRGAEIVPAYRFMILEELSTSLGLLKRVWKPVYRHHRNDGKSIATSAGFATNDVFAHVAMVEIKLLFDLLSKTEHLK